LPPMAASCSSDPKSRSHERVICLAVSRSGPAGRPESGRSPRRMRPKHCRGHHRERIGHMPGRFAHLCPCPGIPGRRQSPTSSSRVTFGIARARLKCTDRIVSAVARNHTQRDRREIDRYSRHPCRGLDAPTSWRVMDLPEVQASSRLEATVPLGDVESLKRLRERTEDTVARPAGSTCGCRKPCHLMAHHSPWHALRSPARNAGHGQRVPPEIGSAS